MSDSSTYCPLPWMHMHVGVTGQVQLCCVSKPVGNITDGLENIWNNDKVKNVRTQLLNNQKPTECADCFYKEDHLKSYSLRQSSLGTFKNMVDPNSITLEDGTCTEMKLRYIDFRFNNLCNFKCRICDSNYSTSIASETLVIREKYNKPWYGITPKNIDAGSLMYEEFKKQYPYVKKIYFAGGEPIMQKEHFMVLKDLIELGRAQEVELLYSTNGSKFKNALGNMFDYWKHFKLVDVTYSIDAYGKQAEYWRHGGEWEDIENNMRECLKYPNIKNRMHSTLGWPNILNWIEFVKYAIENKLFQDIYHGSSATAIQNPKCFDLTVIPNWKKKQIIEKLDDLNNFLIKNMDTSKNHEHSSLLNIIVTMKNALYIKDEVINKQQFYDKINVLDLHRKESFFDVFPEHLDLKSYLYE